MSKPPHATSARRSPRTLITAGPTHEPIDRVRYIGNRSSGRMGLALTKAATARKWPVTLLLGPVAEPSDINPHEHSYLNIQRFQTADDLQRLLHMHWPSHDLLLMAAAVADYTVEPAEQDKVKRSADRLMLELVPTPDLLASLAPLTQPSQTVVGFALESRTNLEVEAIRKLKSKSLQAIVANPLETMDAADVTASVLLEDGRSFATPSHMPKTAFADWLLDLLEPTIQGRLCG